MTYFLIIIAFNFWFLKPGSRISTINVTGRPICFMWLTGWPIEVASTSSSKSISSFFFSDLSSSSTLLAISRTILLKKNILVHQYPLKSHWLFTYGLVIFPWDLVLKEHPYFMISLLWPPHNETFFCSEHWIFFATRFSSIFSSYLFIWLYIANTLAKYSEMFFDSSICNFSKSPRSFCRHTFLILSAFWFDSCKTSHACLAVVALTTISKVVSSRHWWMIVSAC